MSSSGITLVALLSLVPFCLMENSSTCTFVILLILTTIWTAVIHPLSIALLKPEL